MAEEAQALLAIHHDGAPTRRITGRARQGGGDGVIAAVEGSDGVSPMGASAEFRRREAEYARGWYASMMADIYG